MAFFGGRKKDEGITKDKPMDVDALGSDSDTVGKGTSPRSKVASAVGAKGNVAAAPVIGLRQLARPVYPSQASSGYSQLSQDPNDDESVATSVGTFDDSSKPSGFQFENLVSDDTESIKENAFKMCGKHGMLICTIFTAMIYLVGLASMLVYAMYVSAHSPTLGFSHTVLPVALHCIGVGCCVAVKVYYDFSPEVGHLESMHLIIRSRMWLFPGVLHPLREVKRSVLDAQRLTEFPKPRWDDDDELFGSLTFDFTDFLRRCQLPEFRCLFRAYELYPWSKVAEFEDLNYADLITQKAMDQTMRVFPILDLLNCLSNVIMMTNPMNYVRLIKSFGRYATKQHSQTMNPSEIPLNGLCTRSEELEIDDVSKDAQAHFIEKMEAKPWGTLRLMDFGERFNDAVIIANLLGISYGLVNFLAYLGFIFGEIDFYARLETSVEHFEEEQKRKWEDAKEYDDDSTWADEYRDLQGFAWAGCFLMFACIPFAVQASALMAENVVAPMLVIHVLQAHVTNFHNEMDEYLSVLAVNKGTLPSSAENATPGDVLGASSKGAGGNSVSRGGTGKEKRDKAIRFLNKKVHMTRDMALSWRINKFINEVSHDCYVINSSVGLMVLNLACHMLPLHVFVFDVDHSCIPIWIVALTALQGFALLVVVQGGVQCNELINEGIDGLLHDWQLKFNMIQWSGGFMHPGDGDDVRGFVTKDPPGETEEEIKANDPNGDFMLRAQVKADQHNRIQSIVKVLAHYEAESLTPFSVLGLTVTRDGLTLVFGFFGGSLFGLVTSVIEHRTNLRSLFMCHGL